MYEPMIKELELKNAKLREQVEQVVAQIKHSDGVSKGLQKQFLVNMIRIDLLRELTNKKQEKPSVTPGKKVERKTLQESFQGESKPIKKEPEVTPGK